MKIESLLTAVGLSPNEADVYLTLLKGGTQTISSIARTSGNHRPAIYAVIPTLKAKGLVGERHIGKLTHYSAEPPERLRTLLDSLHHELDTIVPTLSELQNKKTPLVRRLDGTSGIYAVFDDIVNTLKKGEEFYRYSSVKHSDLEKIGIPKDYEKRRDEKKLERLVISNDGYIQSREPRLEESLRMVPREFLPFDYNVAQIIYGDKIAFIDYSQKIATIIENPVLAQFQKDIFKMLFRRL